MAGVAVGCVSVGVMRVERVVKERMEEEVRNKNC